jgi:hypothetical protein
MKSIMLFLISPLLFVTLQTSGQPSGNKLALTASSPTKNKVLLNWQRPDKSNYTVKIKSCKGGVIATVENGSSYTVANLSPNTAYSFKVMIVKPGEPAQLSECTTVKTKMTSPFGN